MKRILVIAFCLILFLVSCANSVRDRYKEEFLQEKDSYTEISNILIRHYTENNLNGRVAIWCSEDGVEAIYDSETSIDSPLEQSELDIIYDFISDSRYEYVSIDEDFVEFGNSTGSVSIYLRLASKIPERISSHHTMYNFSGGWYCSVSMAR